MVGKDNDPPFLVSFCRCRDLEKKKLTPRGSGSANHLFNAQSLEAQPLNHAGMDVVFLATCSQVRATHKKKFRNKLVKLFVFVVEISRDEDASMG